MTSFQNPTLGELTFPQVITEIKNYLENEPELSYSLVIGTDSQERKNGKLEIDFVTAIVVRRVGFGGRYFWFKQTLNSIKSLRDKIYTETMLSLNLATEFVPKLKFALNGHSLTYDLEIHVDVGEKGDTREMIREVVGMVNGNGFKVKTKPESYGASSIADKHT
ncbi:ribonuclease H-like YkuK family protein [Candidatus Microgenomates bacterium]|nr:ribonuclease H-like YkuK family protein [Candidatus Microgenomates bacterium]